MSYQDNPRLNVYTPKHKRKSLESRLAAASPTPAVATPTPAVPPNNILIATPCYGSMLHTGYFNSIIQSMKLLQENHVPFDISTIGNESLITRARNYFCSLLLANERYSHILFVDADISFNPATILRMLKFNRPVMAGAYPKKAVQWNRVGDLVKAQLARTGNVDVDKLEACSYDYAINIVHKVEGEQITVPINEGFMKVSYASTGFLMIRRDVIEGMVARMPHLKYKNDISGYEHGNNADKFYALFDCFIDADSKRYLSEDFAFCQRYLDMGGDIWVDLACELTHAGTNQYKGSLLRVLEDNIGN